MLAKIGGEGLTEFVNRCIEIGDRYGCMEGLRYAARRRSALTVSLLAQVTQRDDLWDVSAVLQGYAASALAALGCWREVVAYYVRWGVNVLRVVNEYRSEAAQLSDEHLEPALAVMRASHGLTPGVALALAFGNRSDYLVAIRGAFAQAAPESNLAVACTVALGWLGDNEATSLPLLERLLRVPDRQGIAVITLLANASDEAIRLVLRYLQTDYQNWIAVRLLNDPRTSREVIVLTQRHLREATPKVRHDSTVELLAGVSDTAALDEVFWDPNVRDLLRDAAFDDRLAEQPGARRAAIRGLARSDPSAAFFAARTALQGDGPDREGYPYVLVELDPAAAIPLLMEHALAEKKASVLFAIGRAFAHTDCGPTIRNYLLSPDAKRRRAGAHVATRLTTADWLVEALRRCLGDTDFKVATAAREALETLRLQDDARDLAAALVTETDVPHRWVLLDALIGTADPGDLERPLPAWARTVQEHLPHAMRTYLAKQLEDRRNKVLREAEKIKL
jgi:hypothetical protein